MVGAKKPYDTATQDAIVETFLNSGRSLRNTRRAFPALSHAGIVAFLIRRGLYARGAKPLWMRDDERLLVRLWPTHTAAQIAEAFGGRRTVGAILQYAEKNRKRLGLIAKKPPKWTSGQKKVVETEIERAIDRMMAATGRERGGVMRYAVAYLLGEPKRRRQANIIDLGGMADAALSNSKGRKPFARRKRAA